MITSSNFIHLTYSRDLTEAGIAYACRSLPYTFDRMGGSPHERLRRIVCGKAAELAFRRHLLETQTPHDTLGATPFTDPDNYDVALRGRRCDLKSYLIYARERIQQLRHHPAELMNASALVPNDQANGDGFGSGDLYIFAFVYALLTQRQDDVQKALEASQPVYLLSTLPGPWVHPERWDSLGQLALKCDTDEPVALELGGQGLNREFQTERIILAPRTRALIESDFYSLAYIHITSTPNGNIGIYSPRLKKLHLIQPKQWGNIWVYGMEVVLAGFITRGEFLNKAGYLPAGSRVYQYPRTRVPNLSLPLKDLYPLEELFTKSAKHG